MSFFCETRTVNYNQLDDVCHSKDESGTAVKRHPIYRKHCAMIFLYVYLFKSLDHFHKHILMQMFDGLIYIDKKIGSCLGCREVS